MCALRAPGSFRVTEPGKHQSSTEREKENGNVDWLPDHVETRMVNFANHIVVIIFKPLIGLLLLGIHGEKLYLAGHGMAHEGEGRNEIGRVPIKMGTHSSSEHKGCLQLSPSRKSFNF